MKSLSFGFVISLISCSCGMEARDGAKGVGLATTKAVVWSFVAIVIVDLIFAAACFY
jgi:phospholipid/cholesterol/gamma-HCH transport system permease protein